MLSFKCEKLLALRASYKLGDHPSSAVRECLQYVFASNLYPPPPRPCPEVEMVPCRGDTDPFIHRSVIIFIIARSTGHYRFRGIGIFRLNLKKLCIKIVTVTKLQYFCRVPDLHFSVIYESYPQQLTSTDRLAHRLPI